jgi:nucleoside-diphosphate-sugar epimerase
VKILAIGATGFIGRHVVEVLLGWGHAVAILHRGETSPALPNRADHILAHRDRLSDVSGQLQRFGPDVVFDMILFTERQAHDLVSSVRGVARRLVVVSSADVYRNYDGFRLKSTAAPDPGPLDEDAPLRETRYPYRGSGLSFEHADEYDKILVEQVVLGQPELPATVLRLPAVYGPGDKGYRLRPYLRRMDDGRLAILLAHEQAGWRWTRGYVADVAAAIVLAVTDSRAAGRTYNVGQDRTPSEREWVEQIGVAAGWHGEVVTLPADELPSHLRQPRDWRYDLHTSSARIRKELGYAEPTPSQDMWNRTLAWERSRLDETDRPDYAAEDTVLNARRRAETV